MASADDYDVVGSKIMWLSVRYAASGGVNLCRCYVDYLAPSVTVANARLQWNDGRARGIWPQRMSALERSGRLIWRFAQLLISCKKPMHEEVWKV